MIRFTATLLRPARPGTGDPWTFLLVPEAASAQLPSRGLVTVEGTFNQAPFEATLQPDGKGSHWLRVEEPLREAAAARAGETVAVAMRLLAREPEPAVPSDLQQALAEAAGAAAVWQDLTPVARRDWIHWITSAKKAETRMKRVAGACDMLASGKRRVCCFDRSGIYSKSLAAPEAAP